MKSVVEYFWICVAFDVTWMASGAFLLPASLEKTADSKRKYRHHSRDLNSFVHVATGRTHSVHIVLATVCERGVS